MSTPSNSPDELAGTEQPFIQHLFELRDRLLKAVYGVGAIFAILCFFPGPSQMYDYLAMPLVRSLPEGSKMIAVGVVSPFLVPIKVTVLAALAAALPWVLYQMWAFVAPGLYRHEKRLVVPLVAASTLLFYTGAAFCYFFVFGQAFPAIQRMAPSAVAVSPDIEAYLDFVVTMFVAFGVAFEVPIVVVILARMRVVTIEQLKAFRTYFVVGAAAVSGLVTPPDPVSMIALLVPMVILYEVGIWAAQIFMRYSKVPEDEPADTSARLARLFLWPWPLPGRHLQIQALAFAVDGKTGHCAGLEGRHLGEQFAGVVDGFAADGNDDVARFHPGFCRGTVEQNAGHDNAIGRFQTKGLGNLGRDFAGFHPNPAAPHLAFGHDAL